MGNTYDDDRLLERTAEALFQRIGAGTPLMALPWPAQVVVLVICAQGVIDNGGLAYFFESNWPNDPPYSLFVDAYRAIGENAMAQCLASAVTLFPFPNAHRNADARRAFMDAHWEDGFAQLDECVPFGEAIFPLLANYVRQHRDEILPA